MANQKTHKDLSYGQPPSPAMMAELDDFFHVDVEEIVENVRHAARPIEDFKVMKPQRRFVTKQ
jgi:hypothetical protein